MSIITELSPKAAAPDEINQSDLPHVLLVIDQFSEILGGGERIVLRLAALLPRYGYRASILTFSMHPESTALSSAPCPIYLLPLERTYDFTAVRAAFDFKRFIDANQIQIVETFFESSDIWVGFVARMMSKAKLVWSRRDMGILRSKKHRIAYRLLRNIPHRVFAVSEQVRRYCIEVDRIDPSRVLTIYNGLSLSDWRGAKEEIYARKELVVTTVGNIRRVKGHDIFVLAAATVAAQFPKVVFSIAGEVLEPDYFAELQVLVRDLGLSDRFHFSGGVKDLRQHLSASNIFVLPSRSEGFSNALIEAMAASLPIVATDVGGNGEAVEDGFNGFLVPSEDVAALSAAIIRLISHPTEARMMGLAGRDLAAKKFTTEAMMNQIASAYQGLLSVT